MDDDSSPLRIRRIRRFLGLTQEDLAGVLGTSGVSLNRWEVGKADPSPFYAAIFELLDDAIRVRPADEMIQRLESTDAVPERLICMCVWLARPEGPPASLGRGSAPELFSVREAPPSSRSAPSSGAPLH
jgi:transcriptional regulator with XRE-family HTH domain